MTTTTNYGFNLPAGTDPASITPLNQNTEMIDRYLKANINAIAEDYDENATYNTGDLSVHDNGLYVCNDDGVTGTWDSTKWDTATVGNEIESINATVGTINSILADAIGEE